MDVHRHTTAGRIDKTCGVSMTRANQIYEQTLPDVRTPFAKYYRVSLVDPARSVPGMPYIVRDTEHEIFGIQTMQPGIFSGHRIGQIAYRGRDIT